MTDDNGCLLEQITSLSSQNQSSKENDNRVKQLQSEIQSYHQNEQYLKNDIYSIQQRNQTLQKELEEMKQKNQVDQSEWNDKMASLSLINDNLQKHNDSLSHELEKANGENSQSKREIANLKKNSSSPVHSGSDEKLIQRIEELESIIKELKHSTRLVRYFCFVFFVKLFIYFH